MKTLEIVFLTFLLSSLAVTAQQNVSIEGRVLDPGGLAVSGLTVTALDPATGFAAAATNPRSDGSFALTVPRAIYLVTTTIPQTPFFPAHARVDARNGSVSDVLLRITAQPSLVPDDPPRASRIGVSLPDAAGDARVTGAAGAVAPGSFLVLVTLDTGHTVSTQAREDGSFDASIYAPFGSSILVKSDPYGFASRSFAGQIAGGTSSMLSLMAGTIVRVPEPPSSGTGISFGRAGTIVAAQPGQSALPAWTFQGTVGSATIVPGETLRIGGTVRIVSPVLQQQAGPMRVTAEVRLDRVSGPDGSGSSAQNTFASTLLTPTGLPIERNRNGRSGNGLDQTVRRDLARTASDRAEAAVGFVLAVPGDVPAGFYVPVVTFFFDGVPGESPPSRLTIPIENVIRRDARMTWLPVVRVGSPSTPRIPAMLLGATLSNGTRGGRAIEDHDRFGLSSRLRMNETLIVPRLDAAGEPLTYRLEPFLPTISLVVGGRTNLPLIPFRFPSGRLTLRIDAPDGSTSLVGPTPFLQARLRSNGDSGTSFRDPFGGLSRVGTLISECYEISTLDPRMEVQFARDGRHSITLDGAIEDIWGNTWMIGGTYEVNVARLLSVDTAIVPGTPFEVGDVLSAGVVVTPPVPADVEVRVRLMPGSDPSRTIERVVRGRANRYGHFNQSGLTDLLSEPGEYRVDVVASFVDAQSAMWMGGRTWGSVVAPRDTPIIAHGRRGMVNSTSLGTQWFFRSQTEFPTVPHFSHPSPPFHSGDVFWAQKSDTEFAHFTFQDPQGLVTSLLRNRVRDSGIGPPGSFDERALLGELPLVSTRADGTDPHIDPARVDLWGYSYRFIERPSIAVRELIAEDGIALVYWPFHDQYGAQIGMGANGDLPNDFKFQFGGAVLRGAALARPLYAGYGSLFVLVPDDDPNGGTRIFPPFQGNGGGPSGGPLFTLKGKDIDLFFHLTALRPGSILHRGERLSVAGYSAPPLPSKIEVVLTSPSGLTRAIKGQANKIGYFYDPAQDLRLEEEGVWKAKVKILFDGVLPSTSGQVTPPLPTGEVLGSREGEFYFYVVRGDAPPLQLAPMPRFVRPADGAITFTITAPTGLTNVQLTWTSTMPGFILEEGTMQSPASTLSWTYDAKKLAKDFPNLDLHDADGFAGVDTITISLLVSGTDASGAKKHFARQIVIQGEELQMPEQKETIISPRRRPVRR